MIMNAVHVKILKEGAKLPTYGSAQAAGADLYACLPEAITIAWKSSSAVKTYPASIPVEMIPWRFS